MSDMYGIINPPDMPFRDARRAKKAAAKEEADRLCTKAKEMLQKIKPWMSNDDISDIQLKPETPADIRLLYGDYLKTQAKINELKQESSTSAVEIFFDTLDHLIVY